MVTKELRTPNALHPLDIWEQPSPAKPKTFWYENEGITVFPEYVCAQACLGTGRFAARAVSKAAAERRQQEGRCLACQRNHFSRKKCRQMLGHTAPAAKSRFEQ